MDNSTDCWDRSMSFFDEGKGVCTTVSNCPADIENCMRCETYDLYGSTFDPDVLAAAVS